MLKMRRLSEAASCLLFLFCFTSDQVRGETDVANGKPTSQSSTYGNHGSELAVDGISFSDFDVGSCSSTNNDKTSWWQVDLGKVYKVNSVSITNRDDRYATRLRYFSIFGVSEHASYTSPDHTKYHRTRQAMEELAERKDYTVCFLYLMSSVTKGETRNFLCVEPMKARYIYIVKSDVHPNSNSDNYLTLCEVLVYADCIDGYFGLQLANPCTGTCTNCEDKNCDMNTGDCLGECETGSTKSNGICVDNDDLPTESNKKTAGNEDESTNKNGNSAEDDQDAEDDFPLSDQENEEQNKDKTSFPVWAILLLIYCVSTVMVISVLLVRKVVGTQLLHRQEVHRQEVHRQEVHRQGVPQQQQASIASVDKIDSSSASAKTAATSGESNAAEYTEEEEGW